MRPERGGGGSAAELMSDAGAARPSRSPPSPWRTPTPYLFVGSAAMMGLIVVALLVLICTRRKASSSSSSRREREAASVRVLVPLDREPKVVVIMAGDDLPSFLASAKPLAAFAAAKDEAHAV